ncbi:Adhesion G-Protein Coupled Receptor V1 [Manis pentadactyla]|nr:Adhesion G-Protein Coupled Receptor V1 [Manis pentadactyla]
MSCNPHDNLTLLLLLHRSEYEVAVGYFITQFNSTKHIDKCTNRNPEPSFWIPSPDAVACPPRVTGPRRRPRSRPRLSLRVQREEVQAYDSRRSSTGTA